MICDILMINEDADSDYLMAVVCVYVVFEPVDDDISERLIILEQMWVHSFNVSGACSDQAHSQGTTLDICGQWAFFAFISAADREISFTSGGTY